MSADDGARGGRDCSGRFCGKVLVVTGAAQGIGRVTAARAAREGGKVALVDRDEAVFSVVEELRGQGLRATGHVADLETYEGALSAVSSILDEHIWVDALINTVGGTIWARPYEEYDAERIEAEIRRSLFPTLWMSRAILPSMIRRESGVIVNVSSIATGGINRVPYSAAKGGVNALTRSLAMENAHRGIRVVAAAPGGTNAPPREIPRGPGPESEQEKQWFQQVVDQTVDSSLMGRYGELAEQAGPILFLASDDASYITGSVTPVGGGDLG